jgi:hypothetical protein
VFLWLDIENYKSVTSLSKQKELANAIYTMYLNSSAIMEVNLPRSFCTHVKSQIDADRFGTHLFDEIQIEVSKNLMDTFSRFCKTEEFVLYKQNTALSEEMMKKAGIL